VGSDAEHIGPYVNSHVWAMIALEAAGDTPSDKDVRWLTGQQNSDGGWGWAPQLSSDTNDTAAALEALAAAGVSASSSSVTRAIAYLRSHQVTGGGFTYASGSASDANSTSWVVQGLVAAGQDPTAFVVGGHDPFFALGSLQTADGSVRYSTSQSTNALLCTVQALPALRGRAFPITTSPSGVEGPWRPAVSPRWPAEGASVVVPSHPVLTFSVSDGSGTGVAVGGVAVLVDGKRVSASESGGVWRVAPSGLGIGAHSITVTTTDRAGNAGTPTDWRFSVVAAGKMGGSASATSTASSALASVTAGSASATQGLAASSGAANSTELAAPGSGVAATGSSLGQTGESQPDSSGLGLLVGAVSLLVALAVAGVIVWVRLRNRRYE
jgi:hypothetical protein